MAVKAPDPGNSLQPAAPADKRAKPSAADREAATRLRALWGNRPKGITQQDVAEMLDISQSAVSQYINGAIPLNLLAVSAFAMMLRCSARAIRSDLPEQRFFATHGIAEDGDTYVVTATDERAMLDKYRAANSPGKASLQAFGDALTQRSEPLKKKA